MGRKKKEEEGLSSAELEQELEGTGVVLSTEGEEISEGISFKKLKAKLALKPNKLKF